MTEIVRLIVTPENMGAKGRLFSVAVEGGPALGKARLPFTAGARMLIEAGYSPDALVTMRHAGAEHDSFVPAPLRKVAKWTVTEPDASSARFVPFQERFPVHGAPGILPISGSTAVPVPGGGEIAACEPFSEERA